MRVLTNLTRFKFLIKKCLLGKLLNIHTLAQMQPFDVLKRLTPKSDRDVNSLHNFNEMSFRQVVRIKIIIRLTGVILM